MSVSLVVSSGGVPRRMTRVWCWSFGVCFFFSCFCTFVAYDSRCFWCLGLLFWLSVYLLHKYFLYLSFINNISLLQKKIKNCENTDFIVLCYLFGD
jgi:hypothetical protein